MPYILGALTMVSVAVALWHRAPQNLERYLWAQLLSIPFVRCAEMEFGVWSVAYAVAYIAFTVPILYFICRIALDCLKTRRWRLRASAIAFVLAAVLTKGASHKPVDAFLAISLAEGFVLVWAGVLVAFSAPYTRRPDLMLPLGIFWMVQAAYSYGWSFNFAVWQDVNWIAPPLLGCLTFSFVAYRLRSKMCAL